VLGETVGWQKPRPKTGRPEPPARDRGGFTVEVDAVTPLAPIVQARLWGFWDVDVAERFRAEILHSDHRLGKVWSILVDSRAFLSQTPEVTRHRRDTMAMVLNQGCRRIAVIVTENGTYAMQFMRIASEAGVASAVFLDPAAALKWLREA
jgi:hypothetical protein